MDELRQEINKGNQERFLALFRSKIQREGSERLLDYLSRGCDFFTAPASTRYHGNYPGGLLEHSLNVYDCLVDYLSRPRVKEVYGLSFSEESVAIVALCHDLCKVDFYKESTRNVKEDGVWKTVPYYTIEDQLPYGHGEKSVYIVSGFMRLTRDEAFAIRYHMGFSGTEDNNTVGSAFAKFPLAVALATADMEAAYFVEGLEKK
ncbi:MAG: hydrolase [Clostridia bacterium]|nr:hydrolase [Clostridia bacterium]MBQ8340477.1 hydrolase [Clostridia bacterium]